MGADDAPQPTAHKPRTAAGGNGGSRKPPRDDDDAPRKAKGRKSGKKGGSGSADSDEDSGSDPMLKQAVEVVIDAGQASTSLLQRRCKLGYARAARIMDEMEEKGIIGPYEGAKPRAVLISRQQWLEMQMNQPEE